MRFERFWLWVAFRIPKPLAYWAAIRVMANATQGPYGDQEPGALTAFQALDRWK